MTVYEGAVINEEVGELFRTLATTEELARRECHAYLDEAYSTDRAEHAQAGTIEITEWKVVEA